jgi:hypothetical protein
MEESYTQAILRKIGCYSMWTDTHLLEIKVEATYGTKDDPVSSHIQCVLTMNPRPRLSIKVSFKGGSTLDSSKPFFLANLLESRGRDSF